LYICPNPTTIKLNIAASHLPIYSIASSYRLKACPKTRQPCLESLYLGPPPNSGS
jgi:hypothetical protein